MRVSWEARYAPTQTFHQESAGEREKLCLTASAGGMWLLVVSDGEVTGVSHALLGIPPASSQSISRNQSHNLFKMIRAVKESAI